MSVTLDISDQALAPVAPSERIATLDILRGFGLFGVLWSNLNEEFGAPFWYDTLYGGTTPAGFREWLWPVSVHATTLDGALAWTQAWLIHGHFYTLLGFLFGIGFAIQLGRAERRCEEVRRMFYRRVLVLFAFGLANGALIFRGDVLTSYALVALFLPIFARLHGRRLLTSTHAPPGGSGFTSRAEAPPRALALRLLFVLDGKSAAHGDRKEWPRAWRRRLVQQRRESGWDITDRSYPTQYENYCRNRVLPIDRRFSLK